MKKESTLKKLGKAAMFSAGLLIGAQNAEAGKEDLFKELDSMDVPHAEKKTPMSHKQAPTEEQKNITPDKKGGGMFEAMDELDALDKAYMEFKHQLKAEGRKDEINEIKKDNMRQEIARVALMSGHSKEILQKGGAIANMRVGNGYWIINAQSDGHVVTGSIVSRNEKEKSMFAFQLR